MNEVCRYRLVILFLACFMLSYYIYHPNTVSNEMNVALSPLLRSTRQDVVILGSIGTISPDPLPSIRTTKQEEQAIKRGIYGGVGDKVCISTYYVTFYPSKVYTYI
jgi:hypothetical protein